jgi:transposase
MLVILGADVHKKTHTIVAVDESGRKVGELTVAAKQVGHGKAIGWARTQFPAADLRWAIEDCRHLSVHLERDLLVAGQHVVRVPPKLMAGASVGGRQRGKSDPIDALAVARAALREPDLPVASSDEVARELKLLVDRREDLVAERTREINRLRWMLHQIDPDLDPGKDRQFTIARVRAKVSARLEQLDGLQAEIARDELDQIGHLSGKIAELTKRISVRTRQAAPELLAIPGCAELCAAKILGETAGIARFRDEAAFAMHAGAAPIPVWSGATHGRVRLTRGGNRQLNTALHRIAVTQTRLDGLGRTYYQHRLEHGDTKAGALRNLKRRLARTIFNTLKTTQTATSSTPLPAAA